MLFGASGRGWLTGQECTPIAACPGVGLVCGRLSAEVERGLDGCTELGFLFRQEETELAPERADGNGDDVVAADDTGVIEPVGPAHRHLGGQPANRAGDRRDGCLLYTSPSPRD